MGKGKATEKSSRQDEAAVTERHGLGIRTAREISIFLKSFAPKLANEPTIYEDFLKLRKYFKLRLIDAMTLSTRLHELFVDNPDFTDEFNTFVSDTQVTLKSTLQPDMVDGSSEPVEIFPLTADCKHYTHVSQVDWDNQRYWQQRYSIFSRYDEGIQMTSDGWFGVTPEPVAKKVAEDYAAYCDPSKAVLIDMFAGVGGNTIAFALSGRWSQVIAIEKDRSTIACAQHNAAIYGVADKVRFIHADSLTYLATDTSIDTSTTAIFASPPWGGPGYRSAAIFNLNTMRPYSARQIHRVCGIMVTALFLPRNSNLRQIARLADKGPKIDVVQYCVEGASKALVAYIPGILD